MGSQIVAKSKRLMISSEIEKQVPPAFEADMMIISQGPEVKQTPYFNVSQKLGAIDAASTPDANLRQSRREREILEDLTFSHKFNI